MKKFLLLILAALVIVGCTEKKATNVIDGQKIVTIDSCEYFEKPTYGYFFVYTHKGNCRFCKERRQKEMEELMIKLKEK